MKEKAYSVIRHKKTWKYMSCYNGKLGGGIPTLFGHRPSQSMFDFATRNMKSEHKEQYEFFNVVLVGIPRVK